MHKHAIKHAIKHAKTHKFDAGSLAQWEVLGVTSQPTRDRYRSQSYSWRNPSGLRRFVHVYQQMRDVPVRICRLYLFEYPCHCSWLLPNDQEVYQPMLLPVMRYCSTTYHHRSESTDHHCYIIDHPCCTSRWSLVTLVAD